MVKAFRILVVGLLLLMAGIACDKENYQVVPYVPVYLEINLNLVNELMVPGNSLYFGNQGYAGIVVYCFEPGSTYYAYDAACTHELSTTCKVKNRRGTWLLAAAAVPNFLLMGEAYPSKGPATFPLQPYRTSVMGNRLLIYNR